MEIETKTIRQSVEFGAPPHEVYEALMDSEKHSAFTGDEAEISREVGGRFYAYNGYIEGTNVELQPDTKIVQRWRSDGWPEGHYSIVTFELKKTRGGTKLSFTQEGVPDDDYESRSEGWVDQYWDRMKDFLGKGRSGPE